MRGDVHDTVDAFLRDQQAAIRLDGDATRLSEGSVPAPAALIDDINAERVGWFLRRQPDGSVRRSLPPG